MRTLKAWGLFARVRFSQRARGGQALCARACATLALRALRVNVLPLLAGPPFGMTSILCPPPPMPAQITLEFLPALDWTGFGPAAADDRDIVGSCYDEITAVAQTALNRLAAERPHPLLLGCSRLADRAAAGLARACR